MYQQAFHRFYLTNVGQREVLHGAIGTFEYASRVMAQFYKSCCINFLSVLFMRFAVFMRVFNTEYLRTVYTLKLKFS